jgi:hypothetical protein
MDMMNLLKLAAAEHYARLAAALHRTLKGLDPEINPDGSDSPPKSYKDAVSRKDHEQWEDAMMKEYCWFQDMKAQAVVKLPKGARLHCTLTRCDHNEENCKLVRYRVRMTIRGDEQSAGENFVATDLYTPY